MFIQLVGIPVPRTQCGDSCPAQQTYALISQIDDRKPVSHSDPALSSLLFERIVIKVCKETVPFQTTHY